MTFYDNFIPIPALHCPVCKNELKDWTGFGGENAFFTWKQTRASPVSHDVDDDMKLSEKALNELRIRKNFVISTSCCHPKFHIEAIGGVSDDVWVETELLTSDKVSQYKGEKRAHFKARKKWLSGGS